MSLTQEQRYDLKLRACYYLYENGLTQTEIAKRLNISRVTLGRLLEEARAEGMVKIQIVDINGAIEVLKLEEELRSRFGLQDIKLVDSRSMEDEEAINQKIASEAASYFENILKSHMSIGITWGRTLSLMIDRLPSNKKIEDLKVYSLVGGASQSASFQPNILVQRIIDKYNGRSRVITAPFMCQSKELCEAIKKEPAIAAVLDASHQLDITLVGVGEAPAPGEEKLSDYPFGKDVINELVNAHAAGDICGNFFDINGDLCETTLKDKIVSIDIRDLPNHKNVIGIGGGKKKTESVLGALNGHYLQVLISDTATAGRILDMM